VGGGRGGWIWVLGNMAEEELWELNLVRGGKPALNSGPFQQQQHSIVAFLLLHGRRHGCLAGL